MAPLLRAINGEGAPLSVYDPYYCRGGVKHLASLLPEGSTVHNEPEDFYKVKREGRCPDHDVLLTNPPYSKDHIRRAVDYCVSRKAPWLMLLPHNVMLRDWFQGVVSRDVSPPMFLCPHQRYSFDPAANLATGDSATAIPSKHVPFVTIWFIGGLSAEARSRLLAAWERSDRGKAAKLAQTVEEMPRRIRKILRFARRRVNKKARKLRERKTKTPRSLER